MRKIYFFIALAIVSLSLIGQVNVNNISWESGLDYPISKVDIDNIVFFNTCQKLQSELTNAHLKSMNSYLYQLDSALMESYSADSDTWSVNGKEEFEYNADKRLAIYIMFYIDDYTGMLSPGIKKGLFYDDNGFLEELMVYNNDMETDQWYDFEKDVYTYNDDNQLKLIINYLWDSDRSDWVQDGKIEISYNDEGDLASIVHGSDNKDEFIYNASGRLVEKIYLNLNGGVWENGSKEEFLYNSSDEITSVPSYYWEANNSEWVNYAKKEYLYDGNGNPTQQVDFHTVGGAGTEIVETEKYEFNYDLTYSLASLTIPSLDWFTPDFPHEISNKPIDYTHYYMNEITGLWRTSNRTMYYYLEQEIPAGIINYENRPLIFPNPASDYIEFSSERLTDNPRLEIFNIQGKKVISQDILKLGKISIEHLENGIYIYRLMNGGEIYCGKILVE